MPIEAINDYVVTCGDHSSEKCYREQIVPQTTYTQLCADLERQGWHLDMRPPGWFGPGVDRCPACYLPPPQGDTDGQ